MQLITLKVPCANCKAHTAVEVNLWTGEHRVLKAKADPAVYAQRWALVQHYKKLKQLDGFESWDRTYKGRALKIAAEILGFFDALEDPLGIAKECLEDTHRASEKGGWAYNLGTVLKRADEWIIQKQKAAR